MRWVRLCDLPKLKLASGMEYMIRLFLEDEVSEHYIWCEDGAWGNMLK